MEKSFEVLEDVVFVDDDDDDDEDDEELPKSPVYVTSTESEKSSVILIEKTKTSSSEIEEIGNNDDELVPTDLAEVIAESLKQPEQVTSTEIHEWAAEQQRKELEEGEIIDDDCRIVNITPAEPIVIQDNSSGNKNKKGKKRGKGRQGKNANKIQKRTVTMKKKQHAFHHIQWSVNNSGNQQQQQQQNHTWPALKTAMPNDNDIDRRRRTRRTTENDYSSLLKEYEHVKDEIEKKKDDIISPNLIRVLDSDDSDDDDDVALDVLRERALESARQKLKPKVQRLKRQNRTQQQRSGSSSSSSKGTTAYEQMYRKQGTWRGINNNNRSSSSKSSKRMRTVETQWSESDFDVVMDVSMDVVSSDDNQPKLIHFNPGRKISLEDQEEGDEANDDDDDGAEEEARLRQLLLKQIESKRKSSSETQPITPPPRFPDDALLQTEKVDSLIPSRKKKLIDQPPPQKSKIMKIQIDNSRPTTDSPSVTPPPQLPPPPTQPPPPPPATIVNEEVVELADQLEMAAPDVPTDSPLPSTGLMVSHHEGHLLPLQPPVIIDEDDSSSSSEDDEPDLDAASSGELSSLMNKFKERMRQQQLKIERKKLYLADLKKLRKRKLDERRSVKSLLTQLIERQANYENYLKQAFEFITDVRDRQRAARLDIYQSDKIMVELKMKINQVGSKLGLSEGEVIDQKKMIEIERLNKKKNELAEKLAKMADMIKQYNKDESSPVATPPPPPQAAPAVIEPAVMPVIMKSATFDELTIESLPKLNIKLKVTEQSKPVVTQRSRQKREAIAVTRLSSAYKSPLVIFRSYRMSPNFRLQELDVSSATYSHKLNPNLDFCAYNLSGKCNNARCTSQHWRDIVLTPDELFLDLLSYHGELIKLTSFSAYADKLKAAAAFVNRVLPAELNLKLSQKCMVLVDQINAETKIKSHHVSTYAPIERHGLQHNKRKAGGVIVEQHDTSKRLRLDSGPTTVVKDDEDEMRYFYDENENELGEESDSLVPSLQAIKDLEEVTLAEPHNINAWSELVKRLITSRLPKCNELGLACLSEALDQNPKCARLWSQYLRLFYKSQTTEQQSDAEFARVIAFCDDHVELDTGFWQLRLDLTRNIVDKGQILEKYISRLLEVAEDNDEGKEKKSFEVELTNAILYRTHLLHLESGLDEASATIIGFTAVYNFANVSRLVLWLSWLTLRLTGQLPDCFTTVNIDLRRPLALKSPLALFDPAVYPFFERLGDDEMQQFELDPSDLESVTQATSEIMDQWCNDDQDGGDSELLLLQIVEIIHKSKNAGDFASSCADKMRMASFYALAIYLQSESLQIDDNAAHAPSVSFVLSYQAAEQANDKSSAAGFLESTISRYYKGGDSIKSEHLIHLYRRLLQVTLSEKEPLLNVNDSITLPELSSITMVLGADNLWLWCCYLLAQSLQNDNNADDGDNMVPYFELVLRAISNIKMATSKSIDARPVWLFYIKWCSLHRPSETSQLIQRYISQDPSSTSVNHLIELYFGMEMDQALLHCSGSEMLNNIWNNTPQSSISTATEVLAICAQVYYDNEQFARAVAALRPLVKSGTISTNGLKVYAAAERKLNERAMTGLLRKLVECHYTRPNVLHLAHRYWASCCGDAAQRKGNRYHLTADVVTRLYDTGWM